MASKQIDNRYARKVMVVAQRGGVSTQDIVEQFIPLELYNKLYCGLGVGKRSTAPITLTDEQRQAISFALCAMANTFLDIAPFVPKQVLRKGEKID